jgi:hypothetical protein
MIPFHLLQQKHFQSIHYTYLPLYFTRTALSGAKLVEKMDPPLVTVAAAVDMTHDDTTSQ